LLPEAFNSNGAQFPLIFFFLECSGEAGGIPENGFFDAHPSYAVRCLWEISDVVQSFLMRQGFFATSSTCDTVYSPELLVVQNVQVGCFVRLFFTFRFGTPFFRRRATPAYQTEP